MFMVGLGTWLLCRSLEQKRPSEEMAQYNHDFEAEDQEEESEEKRDLDDENDEMLFDEDFDAEDEAEEEDDGLEEEEEGEEVKESAKMKVLRIVAGVASKVKDVIGNLITTAGKVVVTVLLGLTGMMLPSLTSAVYFFVFLALCTWWSFCRTFDTLLFSCLCVLMAIFSAGHLIVLYLYQFQFLQDSIPHNDSYISVFGISSIVQTDCVSTWRFNVNSNLKWYHFVNPIMLLVLYYTLATLIRLWLQDPMITVKTNENEEEEVNENSDAQTANRRRQLWWMAHQKTEEKNVSNSVTMYNGGRIPFNTDQKDGEIYEVVEVPQEEEEEKTEDSEQSSSPGAFAKVFRFIMKQSYVCALIAMMAWSITYVSWLTFVFLLWSCALWMVRDRRKYAMLSSPFMVAYGNLLLVLQYIWSFEHLKQVPGLFPKMDVPFTALGSKVLCLLSFWLLLHQTLTERQDRLKEEAPLSEVTVDSEKKGEMEEDGGENDLMQVVGKLVMAMLVKYWIYICGGMFFFVSFEGRIVMYKIIYMMLLLFCVALYQVHYEWWRRILKYFWMSVVVYTMLVVILIYTCQFEASIPIWSNITGISVAKLNDLGLERFSLGELFTRIFIPTSFLLVCILHLHYFHEHFLELTDLKAVAAKQDSAIYRLAHPDGSLADLTMMSSSPEPLLKEEREKEVLVVEAIVEEKKEEGSVHLSSHDGSQQSNCLCLDLKSKWHLVVDRLTVLFLKFLEYFHKLQLFIWWLLEIHIIKIVSSYIILVSVTEVSLLNYVFLASWAFALPYRQLRPLASSICTVWTCVIIICKMLYQLQTIRPETYSRKCTMPANYSQREIYYMNTSLLYIEPVDPANWVGLKKFEHLLINLRNNLLILAILAFEVTIYRHQEYFRLHNKLSPPHSRTIFHDITRQHLDNGIVNCIKYFINYSFYKFGVEVCQIMCYFILDHFSVNVIGIPPAACKDYPWRFPNSTCSNVIKWLYLPDFHTKPNSKFLLYDFMLLLSASLQRQVFDEENKAAVRLLAGDNVEICRDLDAASFSVHNPVPDFIHCRSYLDMFKVIVFSYLFWFVLTIIFITGTTRISIFCMGYLVACFYFLLFGGELLLKPIKKILHYWDFLIAYNVFVITMKNVFSILACGYINKLIKNFCWLIQLLSLACTIKEYEDLPGFKAECDLPRDEAGIIWDSICFSFLLLQRRVFMSYYFLHVVADIRAGQILASRGAELFQASIVKAVRARLEEENKSMEQLKRQMDRIKTRQEKFKKGKEKMLSMAQESADGQNLIPPEGEDDDGMMEASELKGNMFGLMVRSGDYYLFETDSEQEEEEEEKKEDEPPKKSAFQFVYHAWITDSKTALKQRSKERRHFWRRYGRGHKHRKEKKEGHVAIEVGDDEKQTTEEKKEGPDNIIKRVFNIIKFTWVLFLTTLDSLTVWINSICKEYIDISTVLRIERCMLTREVKKGNVPSRESIHVYYQKQMRLNASRESGLDRISEEDSTSGSQRVRRRRRGYTMESQDSVMSRDSISSGTMYNLICFSPFSRMFFDEELEGSERFYKSQPLGLQLCYALYNLLVAHSEMVCYLVIILNHMISASMATLVLPILIFLWAMLSVPRPSKRFWMTAIVYTEVTIVIKYFFQFSFFPFNQNIADRNKPYHPPNIIGVEKKDGYVHYDLVQLLALFFHRSILKCHGLWDDDDPKAMKKDHSLHRDESEDEEMTTKTTPQCTYQRRKSSSGVSHVSRNSSMRSKRGEGSSTSTRNSIRREGSEAGVQPKSRKELIIEKIREQLIKAKVFLLRKAMEIYLPIRQFFYNLIHPEYSAVTDVYVLMFLADTVDFIIIVFGFWAFGKHQGGTDITSSLSEDQVPGAFLVMVLIQFGTMVVDRALYLRKTVMGKVIFQVILVFGIHFWMFFILPGVTERRFSQNTVAQLWYFVKCIYFGLSAYQIRCGYPTRVLGNFLTKSYNYVNLFLFQGFRLIPFLTELRAVMDWVWTDTTLSLSSWICVEDIYAHIFVLKCWRESEKRYPQPRGQKKKKVVKYGMGGMIVMLLICIVWFPLLFMSLVKSVAGVVNTPLDVSVSLTLGGFEVCACGWVGVLFHDLTIAHLEGNSNSLWTISPPSKKNLIKRLATDDDFPLTMTWSIQRDLDLGAKAEVATGKHIINLDKETKENLTVLLNNATTNNSKTIDVVYLRAPSDSNSKPIEQLNFEDINLSLKREQISSGKFQEWWIVNEIEPGIISLKYGNHSNPPKGMELYIFSDQVSPPSLGFLAGYGIMGLYMSVVLVIGKFVREFFSGISHTIMFEELPNVDRILKLCTDIFLVRETGELDLEEDLYAKLIFLYRSPETMIKWTREKKQ
uniref:Piezo-type mechanosensitive ion channel component n=1 Tax=Pygocentrus nattereri TaxID=42514 RepID=A0AAR2JWG6_PYGNA